MTLWQPDPPEGFENFWRETFEEADEAPLDYERKTQHDVVRDGFTIDVFSFRGVKGTTLHGWFAFPSPTPTPAFLWLPPYSRWSMVPNEYGTREGFCSLSLNYFGEHAFHSETYKPERGYLAEGIESPETWVFRRLFQDSVIAGRILQSLPEVDPGRIGSMGMSQGGGISIWLGAFCPFVRCVVGDMPFGAARPVVFARDIHRYPLRELIDWWSGDPTRRVAAMRTMSYFDTVNMASLCRVPTLVTYGTNDPAVREYEVRSVFEALAGEKKIEAIESGHDWHESMVERNRAWLEKWL
ncbi:MAG: acetylxylan esterase [Fimbriimonadaceae bacterium]